MGDHTAYYRTAPGDEEIAFVRIARALSPHCTRSVWHDSKSLMESRSYRPVKGQKSKRRRESSSDRVTLADSLDADIDSLSDVDLADRIRTHSLGKLNRYYFDAQALVEHERFGGYLMLELDSQALLASEAREAGPRLHIDFRLTQVESDDDDGSPDSLRSRAASIEFICCSDGPHSPIEHVMECFVVYECAELEASNIFSRYDARASGLLQQLQSFSERLDKQSKLPSSWTDAEVLEWYISETNTLPDCRAWKAGVGVMTSTVGPRKMNELYLALLDSLG